MRRILVPYYSAGYGHYSFAKALLHYFRLHAPEIEVRLFDISKELQAPDLQELYVDSWKQILAMPFALKKLAFGIGSLFHPVTNRFLLGPEQKARDKLDQVFGEWQPDAILATHWGAARLFSLYRKDRGLTFPLWYIYTELGGAYPLIKCGADVYYALTDQAARDLTRIGVAAGSIRRVGLVVQPDLQANLAAPEYASSAYIAACRQELGLHPGRFTLVFSLGGEGIGSAMAFLKRFYHGARNAQIMALTGNNTVLHDRIRQELPPETGKALVLPFGYLPDLTKPFVVADAFAGKCGTSYAMETVKLRKPLLVCYLGAPNEAENMKWLVNKGFACHVPSPGRFVATINRLADRGPEWLRLVESLGNESAGNGAEDIVRDILNTSGVE